MMDNNAIQREYQIFLRTLHKGNWVCLASHGLNVKTFSCLLEDVANL